MILPCRSHNCYTHHTQSERIHICTCTYTRTTCTHTHAYTHTHTCLHPHKCADLVSEDEVKAFFAESLIMKDFSHTHILGLLGVCFDSPDLSPYIVLPFMANGNMKDYLKSKRVHIMDVDTYPEVCEKLT